MEITRMPSTVSTVSLPLEPKVPAASIIPESKDTARQHGWKLPAWKVELRAQDKNSNKGREQEMKWKATEFIPKYSVLWKEESDIITTYEAKDVKNSIARLAGQLHNSAPWSAHLYPRTNHSPGADILGYCKDTPFVTSLPTFDTKLAAQLALIEELKCKFTHYWCKARYNQFASFTIDRDGVRQDYSVVFFLTSFINHHCRPNTFLLVEMITPTRAIAYVITTKDIQINDEITCSYVTETSKLAIKSQLSTDCQCSDCLADKPRPDSIQRSMDNATAMLLSCFSTVKSPNMNSMHPTFTQKLSEWLTQPVYSAS